MKSIGKSAPGITTTTVTTANIIATPQMNKNSPILLVHNHYQKPGGEERVFAAEAALLEENGHNVVRFEEHNERIHTINPVALGIGTIWNHSACKRFESVVARTKPRVVHFHNTFPLISPAAYYVARRHGAAVVQTLHNYRLICANGLFFRDGKPCERCLETHSSLPAVLGACYRDSVPATAAVASMLSFHRMLRTFAKKVDVYIALTEFARRKFVDAGLPEDRIVVKPNFCDWDGGVQGGRRSTILFVGKLSNEKGIPTLLDAWSRLSPRSPLELAGDGPLADSLRVEAAKQPGLHVLGQLPSSEIAAKMRECAVLVFPSQVYEGHPMTLVEAFALGVPVVASDHGAMASMIRHGE